jgi:hypothetical protein
MKQNLEAVVDPNGSQTTISEHPTGGTIEHALAWLECLMGEQLDVAGTLSEPLQQKDKIQIPS